MPAKNCPRHPQVNPTWSDLRRAYVRCHICEEDLLWHMALLHSLPMYVDDEQTARSEKNNYECPVCHSKSYT